MRTKQSSSLQIERIWFWKVLRMLTGSLTVALCLVVNQIQAQSSGASNRAVASRRTGASGTAPADQHTTRPARLAVPGSDELSRARQSVRDVFKTDYAKNTAPALLSKKLLDLALETRDNPTTRYAMLCEARDLAIRSGQVTLAVQAVEVLAGEYEVDLAPMWADTLEQTAKVRGGHSDEIASLAGAACEEALLSDSYDMAERLARLGQTAALRSGEKTLQTEAAAQIQRVRTLKSAYESVREALNTVQQSPADPVANLAVGKWLCFVKGDWSTGIPRLARGSDAPLAALARKDEAGASTPAGQIELGDAWWNWSKAAGNEQGPGRERAAYWYTLALPYVSGLDRVKAERRNQHLGVATRAVSRTTASDPTAPTEQVTKAPEYIRTQQVGSQTGATFEEVLGEGALLVGFRCGCRHPDGNIIVGSMQPIYRIENRLQPGTRRGQTFPWDEPVDLIARPGYAVGGIDVAVVTGRVYSLRLIFMRVTRSGRLNPQAAYTSPWLGSGGNVPPVRLGADGNPVVGIYGRSFAAVDAIGLILRKTE